ncbi:hypothetical protein RI129_011142 [Pyrocoelia pectoralis]|uniref:Uncharacterized protein n=1 Tax=Pyrocoelia pectoralis TaxID=417401 RepID=A0AAN7V7H8_9COLE
MCSLLRVVLILICTCNVNSQASMKLICKTCGDTVNEYCCQFHNSCCDFTSTTGCPPPSSIETRTACRNPIRCVVSSQCPALKQCCRTTLCGVACTDTIFRDY